MKARAAVVGCGAVLTACVLGWATSGDQTLAVAAHLARYGVAFVAYVVALACADGLSARGLRVALWAGIAWRIVLVAAPPLLSDDVYRYVWEGRIQNHGGNPYAWGDRPEAERWAPLRDSVWSGVNHKDYTAIYPPLWQLAARAVVALHDSVTAMKAFVVACEIATLLALLRLLRRRGQPHARILIWAWSPLALVEIAGSGHNDALGLLLSVLALASLAGGQRAVAAAALAGAFQAKLLPALFGAAWLRRFRRRDVALGALLAGGCLLPFLGAGAGLVMSLGKYGELWLFNETLFAPLAALAGSHVAAVRLGAVLTLALALTLAARRVDEARAGLLVVVAFLLLTPNALPWYALWLLPFLVLCDAPWALLFTATVQFAYLVYPLWQSGEPWRLGWGIRALEYAPPALVGIACLRDARRRRAPAAA